MALFTPRKREPDPMFVLFAEQIKANQQMVENLSTSLNKLAEAQIAQSKSFTDYLSLFKTDGPTSSHVVRESDEYRWEMERAGFPVDGSPADQAKWVLENS